MIDAVAIMDLLRTVERDAKTNIQFTEEFEPIAREERAIRLKSIPQRDVALQGRLRLGHELAKEITTGQQRFSTVEDECDVLQFLFETVICHPR